MGLWVPPVSFDAYESNVTTPVTGTSVAASATPHSKNTSYTTLIASTAFDAYAISIWFTTVTTLGTDTSMLVDIAIGAAADETVIIPNLNAGYANNYSTAAGPPAGGQRYWFPLYIPAGSRLSATAQAAVISDTVLTTVKLWGNPSSPVWAGTEVIDYGTNLAASKGVDVACGVSSAEGTFTQITASTTRSHYYIAGGLGCAADTTVQTDLGLMDIGVGAATEDPIAEDFEFQVSSNEAIGHWPIGIFCQVPAASRLTARGSIAGGTAQSVDVILYGVS